MPATDFSLPTAERDADLVSAALAGDRDAFRRIVERYQTLICSVAYCATGSVAQSEDLAQETFLTAWSRLGALREPGKLRAWLCGIARHHALRSWREGAREPMHQASPLTDALEAPAPERDPSDQAIRRDEEAILWQTLERIPALYREPLVLYYRQHQSIEHVAVALDLSEATVKQRLSRGRKLVQEEVQAFVESALRQTTPREKFTGAVLASLPVGLGPAAAAGAAATGTATAKSAAGTVFLAPFAGILAGLGAQWLIICATTPGRGRRLGRLAGVASSWIILMAIAVEGESGLHTFGRRAGWTERTAFLALACFWWALVAAMETWWLLALPSLLGSPRASTAAAETRQAPAPALTPGALAVVVAGGHLALFSWMMRLAWQAADGTGAAAIGGVTALLAMGSFWQLRGQSGQAAGRLASGHLMLCAVVLLALFNLRFDVWLAAGEGTNLAELHRRLPLGVVPLLSLAFLVYTSVVVLMRIRCFRRREQAAQGAGQP